MDIGITFAAAHCPWDEQRRQHLIDIKARLAPGHLIVATDEPPPNNRGCWGTQRLAIAEAIEQGNRDGSTHICSLSDDMMPAIGFHAAVNAAVSYKPNDLLSLFSMREGPKVCRKQGLAWVRSWDGLWGGSIVMPIGWATRMLEWADRRVMKNCPDWDDYRILYYANTVESLPMWITTPSLLEHVGAKDSVIPGHSNARRVATWYEEIAPEDPTYWDTGFFDEGGGDGRNTWRWIENWLFDPQPTKLRFYDPEGWGPLLRASSDGSIPGIPEELRP